VSARYQPLVGVLVGAVGGAVYWLAAQLWPSSVAVVLSLIAIEWLNGRVSKDSFAGSALGWTDLFVLLTKYNVLMALTAANLGFPVPANVALGLIMICGQAASHALVVAIRATGLCAPVSGQHVAIALVLGFGPAILLGIPGLIGLAAAILARIGLAAHAKRESARLAVLLHTVRQLTEACFYLGALATWKYI
jgi:cobalamin synthase